MMILSPFVGIEGAHPHGFTPSRLQTFVVFDQSPLLIVVYVAEKEKRGSIRKEIKNRS